VGPVPPAGAVHLVPQAVNDGPDHDFEPCYCEQRTKPQTRLTLVRTTKKPHHEKPVAWLAPHPPGRRTYLIWRQN